MINPRRHGCPWDSEEDAELMRLDRLGVHPRDIAFRMGRGVDAIKNRLYHLKGPPRGGNASRMVLSAWQWIGAEVKARTLTGL